MSFEPRDNLRHIQIEINFLNEKSQGVSLERFIDDATLQRAFVHSLEPGTGLWPLHPLGSGEPD